jgi:hypothetical protein
MPIFFKSDGGSADHLAGDSSACLSQTQTGQLLDVSERPFRRWEAGAQEIPSAAWCLFRLTCGDRYPLGATTAVEPGVEPTCGPDVTHDLKCETNEWSIPSICNR